MNYTLTSGSSRRNVRTGEVHRFGRWALAAVLLLAAASLAGDRFPPPAGYVNDFADVVSPELERKISAICVELDNKTGVEIGVASFKDMGGDQIDDFTNRLFEQWMPGQKGIDNGILIVNAIAERQIRIEVGYGLEDVIPDAVAGRIRREVMTPFLQQNQHGEAYLAGVSALAAIVAKSEDVTLQSLQGAKGLQVPRQTGGRRGQESPLIYLFPIGLFILVGILRSARYRRGGGYWGGGPWIGGGGFGGFGGGGGFGGFGGGMSGGGGSSGGY
jgi:uncharacterized protein